MSDAGSGLRPGEPVIAIGNVTKTYKDGFTALSDINLDIEHGEIFALLGPNGAGKTTLINIVCGIVSASAGQVSVGGHDNVVRYRQARELIGLVPQELHTDAFETVWNTVSFSRGLFGRKAKPDHIEHVLKALSLWDKKDSEIMTLSGGMKRRVMIAKALSHEPRILFLDEPTAGVDVELRRDMWALVRELRDTGVTVILTTHYIEEAEAIADRVGIINKGRLILVDDKDALMTKLGRKDLTLQLEKPLTAIPESLSAYGLELRNDGRELVYTFKAAARRTGVTRLLNDVKKAGLTVCDIETRQSSLEDIFVGLVKETA
jgi:ABC-2 type transport system ATP-binding protein